MNSVAEKGWSQEASHGREALVAGAMAHLHQRFPESDTPVDGFFAPGRVNLIGEHIDYNGGMVFPCAINHGVAVAARKTTRQDRNVIRLCSTSFEAELTLDLDEATGKHGVIRKQDDQWLNYPLGVVAQLLQKNHPLAGCDLCFNGDLPGGSGLSSSAAIEVVTAFALNALFDLGIEKPELARLSQRAENEFVGVACGIMDQFAVTVCRANHALKLDCNTLDYEQVPLQLDDAVFVIANTNQSRELAEAAYNERVAECTRALEIVQQHRDASSLADVLPEDLALLEEHFQADPVALARAQHVTSEQQRVLRAVDALKSAQLVFFGELMTESHRSLRNQYEVSSEALDLMVDAALDTPGTLGSRLTGAGFGGCTINLVEKSATQAWLENVGQRYTAGSGLDAGFYVFQPGDGVSAVPVSGAAGSS